MMPYKKIIIIATVTVALAFLLLMLLQLIIQIYSRNVDNEEKTEINKTLKIVKTIQKAIVTLYLICAIGIWSYALLGLPIIRK